MGACDVIRHVTGYPATPNLQWGIRFLVDSHYIVRYIIPASLPSNHNVTLSFPFGHSTFTSVRVFTLFITCNIGHVPNPIFHAYPEGYKIEQRPENKIWGGGGEKVCLV